MNKEDAHIVIAMANHNMNVTDVARAIFAHRNTVLYHLDKVLDNEQAKQLADYAVKKEVYNWDGVESVVATALMHENKVVINANW